MEQSDKQPPPPTAEPLPATQAPPSNSADSASKVEWGIISAASLKEHYISMFQNFITEKNFENKCRILLDLFKMQIVFAGMLYE